MVRVISAYNFQEQNTYSINGDIVDACLINSDRLAIAQRNHLIEIFQLKNQNTTKSDATSSRDTNNVTDAERILNYDKNKNCPPTKVMFPTVDQVQQLLYCKAGNFLLTLECKTDSYNESKKRFIRAYVNFEIVEKDSCFSVPIRARIASKITPKTDSSNCIEVIELPFNENPDMIACCQMSGAILISSDKILYLYECQKRANLAQKFTYIDFNEVPFFIELEFTPKKLKIEENVISCMNELTVIAFKIIDLVETNTEDGSTSNSIATGSSVNAFNQNINNAPIDFEVAKQCNQVNGVELFAKIRSTWDSCENNSGNRSNFAEEKPILVNDVKILLKYFDEYNNDGIFYSIKSLLQLRQPPTGKIANQIRDEFRSITLKPIYYKYQCYQQQKSSDIKYPAGDHVLKSKFYPNCVGFSFFVSTVSDGYLYQFTNQEKWYVENTKCLAIYPFTAPVLDVIIDNYVIHAITECGIETFSSRIGHKLFSSYFEYPMLSAPYPYEIGPLLDVPICVMGICGFFGIKFVANSDSNLILLSTCMDDNKKMTTSMTAVSGGEASMNNSTSGGNNKKYLLSRNKSSNSSSNSSSEESNEWTLYNLELPKPEILINDIKCLANIYKNSYPDIYYELMEEAHIIIRLARLLVKSIYFSSENVNDAEKVFKENLEKIYSDTCQLLAEYTIMSDRKEIYSQAVAYYSMCKYPVWDIYTKFVKSMQYEQYEKEQQNQEEEQQCNERQDQNKFLQPKSFDSLIYTLKILLSNLKSNNKIDGDYLTQNVKPILHANKKFTPDYNVANEFFDVFMTYSPNEIATICLASSIFRDLINDSLLELFEKLKRKLKPEEQLCYALCLFKDNQISKSMEILDNIQPKLLLQILKQHWIIIFENFYFDNYRKSTFSDFTETILFSTKKPKTIEAIADVFIYLLLVTRYIDLDFILNRFMNYFALNLGQKGYRTSQQILEILLQGYFYDLYYLNNRISVNDCIRGGIGGGCGINIGCKYLTSSSTTTTNTNQNSESHYSSLNLINTTNYEVNEKMQQLQFQYEQQQHLLQQYTNMKNSKSDNNIVMMMTLKQIEDTLLVQGAGTSGATGVTITPTNSEFNYDDAENEAMKILFRMYLGWLKQYSGNTQPQEQQTSNSGYSGLTTVDPIQYRLALIEYMRDHRKIIKRIHSKLDKSVLNYDDSEQMHSLYDDSGFIQATDDDDDDYENYGNNKELNETKENSSASSSYSDKSIDNQTLLLRRRPILFFEKREQFLNSMPPFDENSFKRDPNDGSLYFNDWHKDANVILIKIQAILNSGKLNGCLIDDFISFIHSNPNVIGIDSLIMILLPKPKAETFLICVMPENVLNYAKSRLTTPNNWQVLIEEILNVKRKLPDTEIDAIKLYDKIIYDILQYLSNEKSLDDLLKCIPDEELKKIQSMSTKIIPNIGFDENIDINEKLLHKHSYDGIDESDPFQLIMRSVVAKQRSDALCSMIQSTGQQLYDAMNNSQLHLN